MNIEYFPFDEQICYVKFSSWTYDGFMVTLKHLNAIDENVTDILNGIDMSNYTIHDEWDVMDVLSYVKHEFVDLKPYIKFTMVLRRKTIFYTVNLIIPCVSMSFLTVIVFGLPSESG
jgi:nicotinic acetylcholine receptor